MYWPIGQIVVMQHPEFDRIIEKTESFCKETGLAPATVFVRAIGNSRFVARAESKLEKLQSQIDGIDEYIDKQRVRKETETA